MLRVILYRKGWFIVKEKGGINFMTKFFHPFIDITWIGLILFNVE